MHPEPWSCEVCQVLPLGTWAHSYIGRLMIIPNHRVSAVVSRSPTPWCVRDRHQTQMTGSDDHRQDREAEHTDCNTVHVFPSRKTSSLPPVGVRPTADLSFVS